MYIDLEETFLNFLFHRVNRVNVGLVWFALVVHLKILMFMLALWILRWYDEDWQTAHVFI